MVFYVDSSGDLNFGYGFDLTKNNNSAQSGYWYTQLSEAGVPTSVLNAVKSDIAAGDDSSRRCDNAVLALE